MIWRLTLAIALVLAFVSAGAAHLSKGLYGPLLSNGLGGPGGSGGGGGGGCSNSLNFSQACNSQYIGVI